MMRKRLAGLGYLALLIAVLVAGTRKSTANGGAHI